MGWFWRSSSPKPEDQKHALAAPTPTPTQPPTPEPEAQSTDPEVARFLNMVLKEARGEQATTDNTPPPVSSTPLPSKPNSTTTTISSWNPFRSSPSATTTTTPTPTTTPHELPLPTTSTEQPPTTTTTPRRTRTPQSLAMSEHLLPTTMSCRDAFDYAWHCHTPGSQLTAVYRYGSIRPCTELWDDFWFCMRTKSYSPAMRAAAIQAHYRAKEEAKYGGGRPSSEDVWESREERVPPGTAFRGGFGEEVPVLDDAELQRLDAERRRRIREELEREEKEGRRE
ncbi:hypothetical protein VTK26DRAFT_7202 [Humicola hyalothermophila]